MLSQRQRQWFDTEFYAFVHFGVNTFYRPRMGSGAMSPEAIFNPEKLTSDQWVRAMQSAGMKGHGLPPKHQDGGFACGRRNTPSTASKTARFQGDV